MPEVCCWFASTALNRLRELSPNRTARPIEAGLGHQQRPWRWFAHGSAPARTTGTTRRTGRRWGCENQAALSGELFLALGPKRPRPAVHQLGSFGDVVSVHNATPSKLGEYEPSDRKSTRL